MQWFGLNMSAVYIYIYVMLNVHTISMSAK